MSNENNPNEINSRGYIQQFGNHYPQQFGVYYRLCEDNAPNAQGKSKVKSAAYTTTCQKIVDGA
jgi:hypothetical protein